MTAAWFWDEINMPQDHDFEKAWLAKFSAALTDVADKDIRQLVMADSRHPSPHGETGAVIDWTRDAMDRLEKLVGPQKTKQILSSCACQYPKENLQDIRDTYDKTGDLRRAHGMLRVQFESFLRNRLKLEEKLVQEVLERGWGTAGILEGGTILATKIPKSGSIRAYLREKDPDKRRQLYCHCPRIRDVLKTDKQISGTYCYCGAGFYKGIWEEILQKPVAVEVLESVLTGGEVCTVAVDTSPDL
jgi:hypothetical protein